MFFFEKKTDSNKHYKLSFIMLVILYFVYFLSDTNSLTFSRISSIVDSASPLLLASAGVTVVALIGGFDLSVVGTISLTNVIISTHYLEGGVGAFLSIAFSILIGGIIGLINGTIITLSKIQSVAISLSIMIIVNGLSLLILDAPGGEVSEWIGDHFTGLSFGIIPNALIIPLFVLCLWGIIKKTDLGTSLYAVGSDSKNSYLSGIKTKKIEIFTYTLAGCFYGLSGFMLSAQTETGDPSSGMPFLLLSFAALALGGTSLSGGRGGLLGSYLGAFSLIMAQKILFSIGLASFYIGLFQGILLLIGVYYSVFIDSKFESKKNG
ncbi:ABC transporter permease [Acetobacter sp. DsW_059]|uniref:ABC transporter permease n=1 Tax=Acetobacter sp. DsW_059 TaxID=1670661 RepID=UPI000A3960E8|nr:hypothetical protein [Acetobacter sp. DsW_059]